MNNENIIDDKVKNVIDIIKNKAHIHSIFDKRLKEIDNEYLTSYVNMRKYPTILFVMAKIMEMNNQEQSQVAMYLFNSIN